jgi:hypothetical protein
MRVIHLHKARHRRATCQIDMPVRVVCEVQNDTVGPPSLPQRVKFGPQPFQYHLLTRRALLGRTHSSSIAILLASWPFKAIDDGVEAVI